MDLLSIAPMIDWTYSPFRVFMRILAPKALLYTEMQTFGAIQYSPKKSFDYHPLELPLALQLGGYNEEQLISCVQQASKANFSEINLNLGCPSDKVQSGNFGACLMAYPNKVGQLIKAMKANTSIPISAKTRIGIDAFENYDFFKTFIDHLIANGCDKVIIHARKAWLSGLSPKQNRTIPPINYDFVYRIKKQYPNIPIIINGNILTIEAITNHLLHVDGVMLGRLACDNPYAIATIHHALYPQTPLLTRGQILEKYYEYLINEDTRLWSVSRLLKPVFNIAHSTPYAKQWKQALMIIQADKNLSLLPKAFDILQASSR